MSKLNSTDKIMVDVEMKTFERNTEKLETLKKEISEKYGVPIKNVTINFIPITKDDNGNELSLASDIISNIQSPEFQIGLFKEYLELKEIKCIDIDEIKKIDNQINAYIDFDQYSKYKQYKFKYVKWKNYLSYGADNYFDFTGLNGLVLLNGMPQNQCGKSTFSIDLLRFALFGKAEKSPTLNSVFNSYLNEETEVIVEACIEIDGIDYVIRRTVTRPSLNKRTTKSKYKQTVDYFKVINGDYELIENCEEGSSIQTNNIIKDSVGNIDDFNLVISANSRNLDDLLRMGQTDKGKLFSRWLGLMTIEKKEEIAKKIWKDNISPKLLSNKYNKKDLIDGINVLNQKILNNKSLIETSNKHINDATAKLEKLELNKEATLKNRRDVSDTLTTIDLATLENSIEKYNNDLQIKRDNFQQLKGEYEVIKNVYFDTNELAQIKNNILVNTNTMHDIDLQNAEIKTKIATINTEITKITNLINGKICPTCGQNVDSVSKTEDINNNKLEIKKLIDEGIKNKAKIDEIKDIIKQMDYNVSILENNKKLCDDRDKLELKLVVIKTNIDNIKLSIKDLMNQKDLIEKNKENIDNNNKIDIQIQNINCSIKVENSVIIEETKNIQILTNDINGWTNNINDNNEIINDLKTEESTIKHWNIYNEMIGKNGIVKIILKRALPIINNEIARILDNVCDFEIKLEINDKNEVIINKYHDGIAMDMSYSGSGLENTFSAIALRSALASISSISRPNFLVLDEIDSCVGQSNYEKLTELYRRVLSGYQFIIHICHTQNLEDIHDMIITVVKDGNISKIKL